ncbi:hypothetical protein [Alkalibacillus haloalkaliphilus]|uniref:YqxM protein n=1 Tax=Alkalibacillus haloalkaliphilus TaxID=94136 RepID=A0A511W0U7_9BACI|nr:hypothetical protein [Alkalibacillus haloalkaliphilus]GEN44341.1 hypothetical protein AHA02nite_01170 [Alkalibacillus haloalkaliphilus]
MRKSRLTQRRKRELMRTLYMKPLIAIYILFLIIAMTAGGTQAAFNDLERENVNFQAGEWDYEDDDDSEDDEWDKSSLTFVDPSGVDAEEGYIFSTVKNTGDDMEGTSEYEIYYILKINQGNGNNNENIITEFYEQFGEENVKPRETGQCKNEEGEDEGQHPQHMQVLIHEGEIPAINSGETTNLEYDFNDLTTEQKQLLQAEIGDFEFRGYHRPGHGHDDENRKCIRENIDFEEDDFLMTDDSKVENVEQEGNKSESSTKSEGEEETQEVEEKGRENDDQVDDSSESEEDESDKQSDSKESYDDEEVQDSEETAESDKEIKEEKDHDEDKGVKDDSGEEKEDQDAKENEEETGELDESEDNEMD